MKTIFSIYVAVLQVSILQYTISQPLEVLQRPTGEHAEYVHRVRRRVNKYQGVGPIEYMMQLSNDMFNEEGVPRDPANNPTSVWCFMDNDVVNEKHHSRPSNRRCSMVQKFNFTLQSLSSDFQEDMEVSKAILRVYIQPIHRLLPSNNDTINIHVNITARTFSNESEWSDSMFISSQFMEISKETKDHWVEWNITNGFTECFDTCDNISHVEFSIHFHRMQCLPGKKKIPVQIADPAVIPVEDEERRDRHWPLQPFVLIFVNDEEEKKRMMLSSQATPELEEHIIGDDNDNRFISKRAFVSPCRLSSVRINFADINMHHVLAPTSYNAKQCLGDCSKRKISDNVVNNHARLLAAAAHYWYSTNQQNISQVPAVPRCVSLSYAYLGLMTINRQGEVKLANYPNMEATSCGCRA